MLRKIVASIVILAVVSAVPLTLAGCGEKEYTIEKKTTETNKPIKTQTVIE